MKINFTSITHGDDSGYRKADRMVIGSKERWNGLWRKHTLDLLPPPPVPEIDFTRDEVIAVFAGEKSSSGYSIRVAAVETSNDSEILIVKIRQDKPGKIAEDVITRPYHMVSIPRRGVASVIFEDI